MKWNVRKLSREKVSVLGRESEMKHAREKSVGERTSKVKNYRHGSDRCLTDKCKLLLAKTPPTHLTTNSFIQGLCYQQLPLVGSKLCGMKK